MSTTTVRKPAPRLARPAAVYRRGQAPKGVAAADLSDSDEDEEEVQEGEGEEEDEAADMPLRAVEGASEDEDEDEEGVSDEEEVEEPESSSNRKKSASPTKNKGKGKAREHAEEDEDDADVLEQLAALALAHGGDEWDHPYAHPETHWAAAASSLPNRDGDDPFLAMPSAPSSSKLPPVHPELWQMGGK